MYGAYFIQSPVEAILRFLFLLIMLGIVIWIIVFWIKMIVHLMESKSEDKIAWVLILLSINIVGALIYYYVVVKKENQVGKQRMLKK